MSWLKKTVLFLLVLVAAGIGLLLVAATNEEVASLSEMSLKDSTRLIRWGAAGSVIIFWDNLISLWANHKGLDDEQTQRAISMRWRVAAWFVAFELIVIEALPVRILGNI